MTTAEMNTETRNARALIDARLEAVEQALIGRISRAERLDIVGEVESRIDELLHERCGPGTEPTRADVLAVLLKIDPPEAYLDFESADEPRQPVFERVASRPRFESEAGEEKQQRRFSQIGGFCGLFGIFSAVAAPSFVLLAEATDSIVVLTLGAGGCALACFLAGIGAHVFAMMGRPRSGWSVMGQVFGTISVIASLIAIYLLFCEWMPDRARRHYTNFQPHDSGGINPIASGSTLQPIGHVDASFRAPANPVDTALVPVNTLIAPSGYPTDRLQIH